MQVVGVHVGYVDTRMAAHADEDKLDPAVLVTKVLADANSVQSKAALAAPIEQVYPEIATRS